MTGSLWHTPKVKPLLHKQKRQYLYIFYLVQEEDNITYQVHIYSFPYNFDIHIKYFNVSEMAQPKGLPCKPEDLPEVQPSEPRVESKMQLL